MTVANIDPQPSGAAIFELNGVTHPFASWEHAVAECRKRGITPNVLPFPNPSIDRPYVQVLAVAPGYRVLT